MEVERSEYLEYTRYEQRVHRRGERGGPGVDAERRPETPSDGQRLGDIPRFVKEGDRLQRLAGDHIGFVPGVRQAYSQRHEQNQEKGSGRDF